MRDLVDQQLPFTQPVVVTQIPASREVADHFSLALELEGLGFKAELDGELPFCFRVLVRAQVEAHPELRRSQNQRTNSHLRHELVASTVLDPVHEGIHDHPDYLVHNLIAQIIRNRHVVRTQLDRVAADLARKESGLVPLGLRQGEFSHQHAQHRDHEPVHLTPSRSRLPALRYRSLVSSVRSALLAESSPGYCSVFEDASLEGHQTRSPSVRARIPSLKHRRPDVYRLD